MQLYRIAARQYAHDLSGRGSELVGGRWTPVGYPVIYTSEHPALSGLEKLVHAEADLATPPLNYVLVVFEVPASAKITAIKHMPNNPSTVGKAWLDEGETLLMQVPSVVVPYAWNYLINVNHSQMAGVTICDHTTFVFDERIRHTRLPG